VLMGGVGVALCALGIGLAIWARTYLGRNWGMPMSRKENPELVTSGPYAYVRHPIYTGLLIAMLGSVTVLPAILSLLGDRVDRGRVPFLAKRRARKRAARRAARTTSSSPASSASSTSPGRLTWPAAGTRRSTA